MDQRTFGRTGLQVSALGLGCGAVGGLMVRGSVEDQERAVVMAVDAGINFLDTAPGYGDGASETNLGRVLARLRPDIILATKVPLRPEGRAEAATAIPRSVEASLRRLGRDSVDLLQLHTPISAAGGPDTLPLETVLGDVVAAFEKLRDAGKTRFLGITALGETAALKATVDSGAFDSAQVAYNLLNPSAATNAPEGMDGPDFGKLIGRARERGVATIGIRALAGGALSGSVARHPIGMEDVAPIGSGPDYESDVEAARRFRSVAADIGATGVIELALRFAISEGGPTTVLVGVSTLDQLRHAIAAVERGPLTADDLASTARVLAR